MQMRIEFSVLWNIERRPLVDSFNIIVLNFFGVNEILVSCEIGFRELYKAIRWNFDFLTE
jgi:hypothetical protein